MRPRIRGVVQKYNEDRGFGFLLPEGVVPPEWQRVVLVHLHDIEGEQHLRAGQRVEYEVRARTDRPGQYRAVRVRPISPEGSHAAVR